MQFTDRLEQELREAVRREEASEARRHPSRLRVLRPALVPVAGLAAAAAVVIAVAGSLGGSGEEHAASPPPLFGEYVAGTGKDEVRLVLVRGGYRITGYRLHMNGALEVGSTRLRLVRPSENELPEAVGGQHVSSVTLPPGLTPRERQKCTYALSATYGWTLSGDALRLEPVRDACVARREYLSRAELRRQP